MMETNKIISEPSVDALLFSINVEDYTEVDHFVKQIRHLYSKGYSLIDVQEQYHPTLLFKKKIA